MKALKDLNINSDPVTQIKKNEQLPYKQQEDGPATVTVQLDADNWTPEQQRQLEGALKSVPSTDQTRWEKIADLVEGKSKRDCIQRYKKLAGLVKEAKNRKSTVDN